MAMEAILAALEAAGKASKSAPRPVEAPPALPPRRTPQPVARRQEPKREPAPGFDAGGGLDALPMHVIDLEDGRAPAGVLSGLFEDGKGLLRAVVAAEVLAPPLSLREQSNWSPPPNAPST